MKETLKSISIILYEENYFFSEAYPVIRWKKNNWPVLSKEEFMIIDLYLKLYRTLDSYEK